MNNFIKMMSKEKFKTSEPFGSALWPNLLRYRTFAIVHYDCMSDSGAYSATGRLQFLGCINFLGWPGK